MILQIRGTKYQNNDKLKLFTKLKLIPEPNCEYDAKAVAVYDINDCKIGYYPKESRDEFHARDNGQTICCFIAKINEQRESVYMYVDFNDGL